MNRFSISLFLFLRLLGLVYLIAFASLWPQALGLWGANGVLPITQYLASLKESYGSGIAFMLPSLFWLHSSDATLQAAIGLGISASLLVMAGIFQRPALIVLWLLYVSLINADDLFLQYQWDHLLLEAGFLAIFLAPPLCTTRHRISNQQPEVFRYLLQWLLFRLMLSSGAVKLLSGDETWRDLSALQYHYLTQPLPNPLAYYAHQLPASVQAFSTAALFFIECIAPFFLFFGRRMRHVGALLLIFLQVLIFLTGNYTFFNLLTIALCLSWLDDSFYSAWPRLRPSTEAAPQNSKPKLLALKTIALSLFVFGTATFASTLLGRNTPTIVRYLAGISSPLRLVSSYGLFAVMTTKREELIFEGSNDLETWKAYSFRWKPAELSVGPKQVAPYQPRLDWQLWFAALGNIRQNPWVIRLAVLLLKNEASVLSLFRENPFPEKAPKYIRVVAYNYRFTTFEEKRSSGDYWVRELSGTYLPPLSLEGFTH